MRISQAVQHLIKDQQADTIRQKQLTPVLLDMLYQQNWFNLWVPKDYGGLNCALAEGCRLLEELAYADGGLGWTVTLCAGANMFAGFVEPAVAEVIFKQPKVCWGGSGMPAGRADKVGDDYVLSGFWKYATGAPHLTHFTVNAWIYDGKKPLCDENAEPIYRSFFVPRDEVLIHYDWDTFGLECTASHSFSLEGVLVPAEHAFDLRPDCRKHADPLFRYPFMSFAECTLAVNYVGMFRCFLDLFERQLLLKSADVDWAAGQGKVLFKKVDAYRTALEQKRDSLYALMEKTWVALEDGAAELAEIAVLSRELAADVRRGTTDLFPYTGIAGAQRDQPLNIVFRHIFTASQHALLNI